MRATNPTKRVRWMLACVALMVAFFAPPQVDSIDARVRLSVTRSILWRGDIAVDRPEYHALLTPIGADGRSYSIYPLGQSLVLVPFELVATGLISLPFMARWQRGEVATYLADSFIAGAYLLGVNLLLALALFKLMRKLGLSSRSASWGVPALFLGSQWLIWGRSLQEETLAALLLAGAALAGLKAAREDCLLRGAIWFGACLGLLANVRYNGAFAALGVCIWIGSELPNARKRLVFGALSLTSMVPWLILGGWYNYARFGGMARSGYQAAMQHGQLSGWAFDAGELFNLLFGADYGLLYFWLPALLLAGAWRRHKASRVGLVAIMLALVAHLVFLAGVYTWARGTGCTGPRFVCHHLLLLAPFIWIGAVRCWRALPPARPVVAGLLALSFVVQLACVLFSGELENMQQRARNVAGLETNPVGALPRRFVNIARLANGTLLEYSHPRALGQQSIEQFTTGSFEVAVRPNLTPWRVTGGIRAQKLLPQWVSLAAWGGWLAAGGALMFCLWRFARVRHAGAQ